MQHLHVMVSNGVEATASLRARDSMPLSRSVPDAPGSEHAQDGKTGGRESTARTVRDHGHGWWQEGAWVVLKVRGQGVGIPAADQAGTDLEL